ncbi:BACON domain-containing protein [Streptomyces sp. NPDC055749]
MTSTRLETPTHTTGAHRAHRRAPHSSAQRTPARYEPYLDGLFTYCLSVLCDHEAATEALGAVLVVAERQDGRCPEGEEERKSWMYALARWMCLRKLTEQKRGRQAHRQPAKGGSGPEEAAVPAPSESPAAEARRRELAQLAWPEAAGTTPEQREALELAVRHRLAPRAVAAVLGLEPAVARELLAAAACEVERTRAALAVVETGNCPTVARLTGDHQVLLSAALRRELVRHVDDCPRCRRAAERAGATGPWPGATVSPAAALPVVEAPRPSVQVAMAQAQRSRSGGPRFGRTGFPLDPKDHAARRDRLRARVLTTTVVATVVAAPVIALWAAYRGAPQTGEGHAGSTVAATERDSDGALEGEGYDHYENAGNARPDKNGRFTAGARTPDVSAEVISTGGPQGPGSLAVTARSSGDLTTITLTASGSEAVSWSAWVDAPWLHLSSTSGRLAPGRSVTIRVSVDHGAEPDGPWRAQVGFAPAGSVVAIDGYGATAPPHGGPTGPSAPATPSEPAEPSEPPPTPTDPTPTPTDPTPSPDPTDPTPTPTEPTPDPTDPTPTPTDPAPSPDPSDPGGPSDPATSPSASDPAG